MSFHQYEAKENKMKLEKTEAKLADISSKYSGLFDIDFDSY